MGRQHAPPSSSEVLHPLHAAAASTPEDAGGNYFNEEFLRGREQEGRERGRVVEQGPRGGDGLMESAGSFLTTARSVTLIVRRREGVGRCADKHSITRIASIDAARFCDVMSRLVDGQMIVCCAALRS